MKTMLTAIDPLSVHLMRRFVLGSGLLLWLAGSAWATEAPLRAQWIWLPSQEASPYNQTIIARKTVQLQNPKRAVMRITADSYYRLFMNGVWVNDGPCRSWPEHFQYDVIDATSYVRDGANEIKVIARYYGVGDFHRVPKEAGLLAQLEVTLDNGGSEAVLTDGSWQVAQAGMWLGPTPKVSVQMEPAEWYD